MLHVLENIIEKNIFILSQCGNCGHGVGENIPFCPNCGYPVMGTELEQAVFKANKLLKKDTLTDARNKTIRATVTLFVVAALTGIGSALISMANQEAGSFVSGQIIGFLFLGLGFWSIKRPLTAITTGCVLYVSSIIVEIIIIATSGGGDDLVNHSFITGLFVKTVVIVFLISGIISAQKAKAVRDEMEDS